MSLGDDLVKGLSGRERAQIGSAAYWEWLEDVWRDKCQRLRATLRECKHSELGVPADSIVLMMAVEAVRYQIGRLDGRPATAEFVLAALLDNRNPEHVMEILSRLAGVKPEQFDK